eukprot:g2889.t1
MRSWNRAIYDLKNIIDGDIEPASSRGNNVVADNSNNTASYKSQQTTYSSFSASATNSEYRPEQTTNTNIFRTNNGDVDKKSTVSDSAPNTEKQVRELVSGAVENTLQKTGLLKKSSSTTTSALRKTRHRKPILTPNMRALLDMCTKYDSPFPASLPSIIRNAANGENEGLDSLCRLCLAMGLDVLSLSNENKNLKRKLQEVQYQHQRSLQQQQKELFVLRQNIQNQPEVNVPPKDALTSSTADNGLESRLDSFLETAAPSTVKFKKNILSEKSQFAVSSKVMKVHPDPNSHLRPQRKNLYPNARRTQQGGKKPRKNFSFKNKNSKTSNNDEIDLQRKTNLMRRLGLTRGTRTKKEAATLQVSEKSPSVNREKVTIVPPKQYSTTFSPAQESQQAQYNQQQSNLTVAPPLPSSKLIEISDKLDRAMNLSASPSKDILEKLRAVERPAQKTFVIEYENGGSFLNSTQKTYEVSELIAEEEFKSATNDLQRVKENNTITAKGTGGGGDSNRQQQHWIPSAAGGKVRRKTILERQQRVAETRKNFAENERKMFHPEEYDDYDDDFNGDGRQYPGLIKLEVYDYEHDIREIDAKLAKAKKQETVVSPIDTQKLKDITKGMVQKNRKDAKKLLREIKIELPKDYTPLEDLRYEDVVKTKIRNQIEKETKDNSSSSNSISAIVETEEEEEEDD